MRCFLRQFAASALCVGLVAAPITSDAADTCAPMIKAIMTDFERGKPGVKHHNTTVFGGQETKNISYSTGFNEGLTLDANGNPASLFRDDAFFITTDGGETWQLSREYSDEEVENTKTGMRAQADGASAFNCVMDVELNGKKVHHLSVDYTLHSTGAETTTEYWVDADNGFVWQTANTLKIAGGDMKVIQVSEPAPDFILPAP